MVTANTVDAAHSAKRKVSLLTMPQVCQQAIMTSSERMAKVSNE